METYRTVSYAMSEALTKAYSTSFSLSMRLFPATMREHIYAIYGMVRLGDECVDTYSGPQQREQLDALEQEVKAAMKRGYSTNPIVHAFALTAQRYRISAPLVTAFFKSMRMDLTDRTYDQKAYETYIYGSAEVVGLMCLKVFVDDDAAYDRLEPGAKHLGAAYQKVNFLRDIRADAEGLGRWYFPYSSFESFDEKAKKRIEKDIANDFVKAKKAAAQLPASSQRAVTLSIVYYEALLKKIQKTPAAKLRTRRIRINNARKLLLMAGAATRKVAS